MDVCIHNSALLDLASLRMRIHLMSACTAPKFAGISAAAAGSRTGGGAGLRPCPLPTLPGAQSGCSSTQFFTCPPHTELYTLACTHVSPSMCMHLHVLEGGPQGGSNLALNAPSCLQATHMRQIQRLIGALCYARRAAAGRRTPYADLFSTDELWANLQASGGPQATISVAAGPASPAQPTAPLCTPRRRPSCLSAPRSHQTPPQCQTEFVRASCALLGQAQDSPLLVRAACPLYCCCCCWHVCVCEGGGVMGADSSGAGSGAAASSQLGSRSQEAAPPAPLPPESMPPPPPPPGQVAVAAGSAALPTLLKLASLAAVQPLAEALAAGQLPVEVPLGREFCFQSVFACPVSRDQARVAGTRVSVRVYALLCVGWMGWGAGSGPGVARLAHRHHRRLPRPPAGAGHPQTRKGAPPGHPAHLHGLIRPPATERSHAIRRWCSPPPIRAEHAREPADAATLRPLHLAAEHHEDCKGEGGRRCCVFLAAAAEALVPSPPSHPPAAAMAAALPAPHPASDMTALAPTTHADSAARVQVPLLPIRDDTLLLRGEAVHRTPPVLFPCAAALVLLLPPLPPLIVAWMSLPGIALLRQLWAAATCQWQKWQSQCTLGRQSLLSSSQCIP